MWQVSFLEIAGTEALNPFAIPLLNTILLLSSGAIVFELSRDALLRRRHFPRQDAKENGRGRENEGHYANRTPPIGVTLSVKSAFHWHQSFGRAFAQPLRHPWL
jgi:hypothetical protein